MLLVAGKNGIYQFDRIIVVSILVVSSDYPRFDHEREGQNSHVVGIGLFRRHGCVLLQQRSYFRR